LRRDLINDFPFIEKVIYLNTASIGLVPTPVLKVVKEFIENLFVKGTTYLNEEIEENIYEDLRVKAAKLLGCETDEVAVFNSVSEALNSIAWALRGKGKIVTTDVEFPTVVYPWIRVAKDKGWRVFLVRSKDYLIDEDELLKAIDEDTLAISVSHVEYLTGQRFDIRELARKAHDIGALLIVDGIQAAGYAPVDVRKDDVDIYITGAYKWLIGPPGAAVAYIKREIHEELEPGLVGWRSVKNMWSLEVHERIEYADTAKKFEYSTSAYEAKLGMAKSIEYLLKLGIDDVFNYNMRLTRYFMNELLNLDKVKLITPIDDLKRGSIVTIKVDGLDPVSIKKELMKGDRIVELSIRRGLVRFSPHFYNDKEDIDEVIDRLRRMIKGA